MKKSLRQYIVWITLIMLGILLFFQVRWIVYSVRFQGKVFKNSVDLALDKTISNLNSDKMVCSAMRECMRCDSTGLDSRLLSLGIWEQIHSSINAELAVYNIDPDYDLFITKNKKDTIRSGPVNLVIRRGTCYTQSLRELLQTSGYELVVSFPGRARFFLNEAGVMLISSVILILLIIVSIIRMVSFYRNELQLADNTRELINNVTHEFKTPMSSIALASNIIRKGKYKESSGKVKEYGDLIYEENQKLQSQVDSLLTLAAVEWEEFEYNRKPARLNELVKDALNSVKLLIEEKKGTVISEFTDNDYVSVDELHITNALVNLLNNALKYSPEAPEISIKTREQGKNILVEISDKGIGIPVKYQKYIFDKYYRVPTGDVHNIKGFGIGLSYVKSVVTAHKGKVMVTGEPGKGSTFTIILHRSGDNEESANFSKTVPK
jgi:two-component system, OmpR family, phosphate regulon sensor histidine kinase PhoR